MKRGIILLGIFILFSLKNIFALGISPAVMEYNFQPGLEINISYTAFEDDKNKELELYLAGDLAEYAKLSKDKLIGSGTFSVSLKLPDYIERPGKNRIYVGVKEKVDEELAAGTIGTSLIMQGVIVIHVPYTGKYAEIKFDSHNANIGEPVKFDLEIKNLGKEDFIAVSKIDILFKNKTIETLNFKNREVKSQSSIKLQKFLNTTNYNAGKYNSIVSVDYGGNKIATAESPFRIGDLFVDIIDYTHKVFIDGIQPFRIEIESGWNDLIEGAYGRVVIFNKYGDLINFETYPTSVAPWKRKNITGFFDTTKFNQGFYDANITLSYFGKEIGKTSSKTVTIEFVEKPKRNLIILILIGILVLVIILIVIIFIRRKRQLNKKTELDKNEKSLKKDK